MTETPALKRPEEIKATYLKLIDRHLDDLLHGRVSEMQEIEDFADQLHIHPIHLSNTIKALTGTSPCGLYQVKIMEAAQKLLADPRVTIRQIAFLLTFEPSQFTKWFKRFQGITPKQFRAQLLNGQ